MPGMIDYVDANDIGFYCAAKEIGCQVHVLKVMNCIAQCLRIKSKLELKEGWRISLGFCIVDCVFRSSKDTVNF